MPGNKITYIKQEEPSFIKQFKQRTGFKESSNVDTKFEALERAAEEQSDGEDEQPQIVVLRKGDLSAEEVKKITEEKGQEKEGETSGKIIFKKPKKRSTNDDKSEETLPAKKSKKLEYSSKKVKNSSLLSFDDEDGEDGSD